MEGQKTAGSPQRNFGYAKILWEIENFFSVTYKKKWEFYSPEFSVNGFFRIKWRFILKASKLDDVGDYVASIYLERLATGDITRPVRVFWNLCEHTGYPFELYGNKNFCEKEGVFHAAGSISSLIKDFIKLQKKLHVISTKKFCIEVTFLVTSTGDSSLYERSTDIGLRSLSQEIGVLCNLKDYNDLTIHVAKTSVAGHKAILTAGSPLLKGVINQSDGIKDIFLSYPDEKSAGKIFSYLYTGNLDYVLRTPSILIDKAIEFFKVKELEEYYMKDELILHTKFVVRELYFKWMITDINSRKETFVISPQFGDRDLNISCRLNLGLNQVGNNADHICIFVESFAPPQFQELYIILDILDVHGTSVNLNKGVRWSSEARGPLGITDFIPRDILKNLSIVGNNTLNIICSVFLPTDSMYLSVVSNRTCLMSFINFEEHYTLFSQRMESLFDTGCYSDLTVKCGNQSFQVHKCVMSARSPVFARGINALEDNRAISIPDIDPDILRIVFRYIYSGVLKNYELSDAQKIYDAAVKLGMCILKYQSAKILEDSLQISNVFDTLALAYANKDVKLKCSACKFIMCNRNEIREQGKWEMFINEKDLYEEFKEYARIHIRNNPEEGLNINDF